MNKTAAKEWLRIASHDLLSAQILFDANHFTDSIGNDLQQALEKMLKSFLAYQNAKIPKSYDLHPNYYLPPKEEIEEILAFTKRLFTTICDHLEIDPTKLN